MAQFWLRRRRNRASLWVGAERPEGPLPVPLSLQDAMPGGESAGLRARGAGPSRRGGRGGRGVQGRRGHSATRHHLPQALKRPYLLKLLPAGHCVIGATEEDERQGPPGMQRVPLWLRRGPGVSCAEEGWWQGEAMVAFDLRGGGGTGGHRSVGPREQVAVSVTDQARILPPRDLPPCDPGRAANLSGAQLRHGHVGTTAA